MERKKNSHFQQNSISPPKKLKRIDQQKQNESATAVLMNQSTTSAATTNSTSKENTILPLSIDPNGLVRDRKLLKISVPLLNDNDEDEQENNNRNNNQKHDGSSPLLPVSPPAIKNITNQNQNINNMNNSSRPGSSVSFINYQNNNNNINNSRRPISAGNTNTINNNRSPTPPKLSSVKPKVSRELQLATIEGTQERNRRSEEKIRLAKAFAEARLMQHAQEKEMDRRTRDLLLVKKRDENNENEELENENEQEEPSPRLYFKYYESDKSPTNACRGREQPPDWLFRARYRAIRNNHLSIPPTRNESLKLREKLSSSSPNNNHHEKHSNNNPRDFYICVKLVRTRFENTSLAKWVFNCEVRQQEYADETINSNTTKRYLFSGLQLDTENFLLFNRRSNNHHNKQNSKNGEESQRKSDNMRILSPLEDLPWLVEETKEHQQKLSLIGNQLRIIVQVIFPIREIVVDTTVQF